jgi:SAM-dependent methyltransferase
MIAEARACHPGLAFRVADLFALPHATGSLAGVVAFYAIVHLPTAELVTPFRELHRVLAPGGLVALRNTTVDALDGFAFLEYFPAARAHGEAMLPRRDELEATLQDAGLMPVLHEVMPHEMARSWAEYCDKIAARAYSLLAMITDAEFEAGLAAMRGARGRPGPIVEPIDFFAFRA